MEEEEVPEEEGGGGTTTVAEVVEGEAVEFRPLGIIRFSNSTGRKRNTVSSTIGTCNFSLARTVRDRTQNFFYLVEGGGAFRDCGEATHF